MLNKIKALLRKEKVEVKEPLNYITFYLDEDEICVKFKIDDIESFALMMEALYTKDVRNNTVNMMCSKLAEEGYEEESDYLSKLKRSRPIVRPSQYQ